MRTLAATVAATLALGTPAHAFAPTQTLDEAADGVVAPAVRLDPPVPTFANDCDEMSWYRQQAGLPAVFDRLGFRESRCTNREDVHTFCCWGWLMLWVDLHLRDGRIAPGYHACGVWSRYDVDSDTPDDKRRHMCAVKVLYDAEGLQPWAL